MKAEAPKSEQKPAPKAEAKPEVKAEAPKSEQKSAPKVEPKPEAKAEAPKSEQKPETKAETKPEAPKKPAIGQIISRPGQALPPSRSDWHRMSSVRRGRSSPVRRDSRGCRATARSRDSLVRAEMVRLSRVRSRGSRIAPAMARSSLVRVETARLWRVRRAHVRKAALASRRVRRAARAVRLAWA